MDTRPPELPPKPSALPTWPDLPGTSESREDLRTRERKQRNAAVWGLVGAAIRIIAFFLPWVTIQGARTIYLSGSSVKAPLLTIAFSVGAGAVSIAILLKRKVSAKSLLGLGIGAVGASILNLVNLMTALDEVRTQVAGRGVTVGLSVGPWGQIVGAVTILIGGVLAVRLDARSPVSASSTATGRRPLSGRRIAVAVVTGLLLVAILAPILSRRSAAPTAASPSPPPIPPRVATTGTAYQGNASHDGDASDVVLPMPLAQLWTYRSDGTVGYPVIADGRVFVATVAFSGGDGSVSAFDEQTGQTLWTHVVKRVRGVLDLAYDGGRVYAFGGDGWVVALEAEDGTQAWHLGLAGFGFTSAPVAAGGQLYVRTSGYLYAIDTSSGTVVWGATISGGNHSAPALYGTQVVVEDDCGGVTSLSGAQGAQMFQTEGDGSCMKEGGVTLAYHDGRIYAGQGDRGSILDAVSGQDMGSYTSATPPAFSGDRVLFMEDGRLVARDLATMEQAWEFTGDGALSSAPLIVGDRVYLESGQRTLFELDGSDGASVATYELGPSRPHVGDRNPDELDGLNAGEGILAVASGDRLVVFG